HQLVALEFAAVRQAHAHRVDRATVHIELVVKVVAGRQARGTNLADHLALPHARALAHTIGNRVHVRVGGLVTVAVSYHDLTTVASRPAGALHDAVARGDDRRAARGGPVDT